VGSVVVLRRVGMVGLVVVEILAAVAGSSVRGAHTAGATAPGSVGMVAIGALVLGGKRCMEFVLALVALVELVPVGSRH